ncbi:MAG TPA: hypothetical protein VGO47_04110 [Chlamydiales bacterium]|nr:hypothetical protein [Chlamydiales bacterium]
MSPSLIVFIGVPAIDLTPFVMQQGPNNPALAKASLELWNRNVQNVAATLKVLYPSLCTIIYLHGGELFRLLILMLPLDLWIWKHYFGTSSLILPQ